ncbi:hypothetical protein ATY41_09950 [Leifsonia xyli subsp. xyli]|uniref:Uncharacterized protein n=2 Tax=Leifsonia xyli subsp. xyli TaxID=59736 RepID=Q6AG90_LEIXX|nr:hypothetical protein [Leifsonia xyli]AAT88605.1 hypothetical protein Lxx06610 [Leifsonia xyli subsp. xyli str. CTCB07]ODA90551.1 hypothetical protein ATY41_09950 [Leifsonia xyli subsp. xyli]
MSTEQGSAMNTPDWSGTVRVDQRISGPRLEELVGLDAKRWSVLGMDIVVGDGRRELRVLAIARDRLPAGGDILARAAAAAGGSLPVREFAIEGVDPFELLERIGHGYELRLQARCSQGLPLRIVDDTDPS